MKRGEVMSEDPKPVVSQILSWASGQPFNNVLLLLILGTFAYSLWFAMNQVIPSHLNQIQKGYESLVESHKDERERTILTYDKWVDRMASSNAKEQADRKESGLTRNP